VLRFQEGGDSVATAGLQEYGYEAKHGGSPGRSGLRTGSNRAFRGGCRPDRSVRRDPLPGRICAVSASGVSGLFSAGNAGLHGGGRDAGSERNPKSLPPCPGRPRSPGNAGDGTDTGSGCARQRRESRTDGRVAARVRACFRARSAEAPGLPSETERRFLRYSP
jgi:hypothetical protein